MEKFSKQYALRTYECDKNNNLRLIALMNILQDMADSHATALGLGLEFCLKHGLAWVGSAYHLQINRLPVLHETITVETWPCEQRLLGAVREFTVKTASGETLIKASSLWILIDFARKRPVSLRDNLPQYTILPEHAFVSDFARLPEIEKPDNVKRFAVRFDDIDVNNHVNNAVYPLWASEAVPPEMRLNYAPAEIEINFKKECRFGEEVEVSTQITANTSLHSIKSLTDGRELARLRFQWQQI